MSSKLSFTVDRWTCISGRSYYGITCHSWQLQSITLDFEPSPGKHTGTGIARTFYNCLIEKQLTNKIQGITVDNALANTTFIEELKVLIPQWNV